MDGVDQAGEKSRIWQAGRFRWDLRERSLVMGILNVTADSFSDGGRFLDIGAAVAQGKQMVAEGAAIIDVGGESTRPGAEPVAVGVEKSRVVPVIAALRAETGCAISVDTMKAEVAAAALEAGADIVNDVSGFRDDAMIDAVAGSGCGLVAMHMRGTPRTMQQAPVYEEVVGEVRAFFGATWARLKSAGVAAERVLWDPGIGFGKTLEHNLSLLGALRDLEVAERSVLIGLSRKSFIGKVTGIEAVERRENATTALTAWTRAEGAMVHRVHAVKSQVESLRMTEAVLRKRSYGRLRP